MAITKTKTRPDFLIVGPPKCGTTALCQMINLHENISISNPKEPGYFSRDITKTSCRYRSYEEYITLCYEKFEDNILYGDGSTTTLYSLTAIDEILLRNKDVKVIVFIRNSVDLVYSHYLQQLKIGYENQKDFEKAWGLQDVRKLGKKLPFACEIPFNLQYKEIGLISKHIDRIYTKISRENILVIDYESFKKEPNVEFSRIYSFLGVNYIEPNIVMTNKSKSPRFALLSSMIRLLGTFRIRLGLKSGAGIGKIIRTINSKKTPPISKEMENILRQAFSEEISRQEEIIKEIYGEK